MGIGRRVPRGVQPTAGGRREGALCEVSELRENRRMEAKDAVLTGRVVKGRRAVPSHALNRVRDGIPRP